MNTKLMSPNVRKSLLIAQKNHWRFKVLGQADMPTDSFYRDQWVYVPQPTMPDKGKDRIAALKHAGVPIKGFIIAHEAPRLLNAPSPPPKPAPKPETKQAPGIVPATGVSDFFATLLSLVFMMFFPLAFIDPALIVVLEDGTWISVMTWFED